MAKYLRYSGEFISRAGILWRIEILQDAEEAFPEVGELTFEADSPLLIEWSREEKHATVCSSIATLKIESPGDRTYEDLYTIAPGRIRMDVYREDTLYWSGALDPEFYEEPYERAANYPVSLTFSDFGVLDRLKYDLTGLRTIKEIVDYAMARSFINFEGIEYQDLTTTYFEDGTTKADINKLSVRSDNFYDEEGEASTLREVIEGILQPLALRIVQRCGKIFIYDLNGLFLNAGVRQIEWDGSSSTMGTDRVYNNAKVNFSPYSTAELLSGDVTFNGEYSTEMHNLTTAEMSYYSFYPDYGVEHRQGSTWDYDLINFTIFTGKGEGLGYLNPKARYFHILPMVGGPSECDGIAWGFCVGHGAITPAATRHKMNSTTHAQNAVLMRTNKVFLPKLSEADQKAYYIRLTLEMLLDPRYNPFSSADDKKKDTNEESNYKKVKTMTGWAFVPIAVTLYDNNGNPTWHYDNAGIAKFATHGSIAYSKGEWNAGGASFGDAWLEYYNVNDQEEDTGILGWKANRHTVGRPDTVLRCNPDQFKNGISSFYFYDSFKQMADGQYIPYPPEGGYLEVTVYAGVNCYDYGEKISLIDALNKKDTSFETTQKWDAESLYEKIRWHLYKAPKLEIVKNNLVFDEAELDDIEYSGYLNQDAMEEVSIDTICGTSDKICPTAKGIFYRTSDNLQLKKLHRAGVTDHPENLLIGTVYSQYADRKTTLEGECRLDPSGVTAYSEINQGDKKFLLAGETQDAIADTTDATFIEFRPDEYEAEK
ncbi:MAG: hypothetical protein K2L45_03310 [Muribaculaceae bacterium]|nr:hypothetical protein [Muribaculaceae bacterium]